MKLEWRTYLACAIQGEGNISLYERKERRTPKGFYFEPRVEITNTDKEWIEFLMKKVTFGYMHKDDSPSRRLKGYKISYRLIICALDDVISILVETMDFLVGQKKILAHLLLEYCEIRKSMDRLYSRTDGRISKGEQISYSPRMLQIYDMMRKINKRGRKIES